ncbi:MAG: putative metal-binding motif-containing protein [Sandaracinaceae bacterium]|nr:putative metal-binding motif-containing protein [Sandaracinaceae bacterium]
MRNPSRVEVCDPDDRDEDCNSATFGELDDDNDSYFSAECCNGSTCGDDCDDARADVNPGLPEVCTDGVDNNCNGLVDDGGAVIRCFRDRDGDGFGRSVEFTDFCGGCPVGWASAMGDCEDDVARANPGADFQTGTYIDSDAFDRPTGDWNCDMREETRWRQPITQACGFDTLGDCTGEWWESAAVGPGPSCGATGTYLTCAGTRRDGCYTNAAVRMQECR